MGEATEVIVSRLREGEETLPRGRGLPPLRKRHLYLYMFILGGIAAVMFTLLGIIAYRNIVSERELILQNALLQGYWIARSRVSKIEL